MAVRPRRQSDQYLVILIANLFGTVEAVAEKAIGYRQDIFVEYGPHIIKKVKHGGVPKLAANVSMCWPPEWFRI